MIIQPSDNPGAHERHLVRRHRNILFGDEMITLDQENMIEAQQQDHEQLLAFHEEFQEVLSDSVQLKPNVDSDIVLKLKDRLDRLYEQASVIADDQNETKTALRQLLDLVMTAVRVGAGSDQQALQELDQEQQAREAHFTLLQSHLVADLLDPHSPVHKDELVPTLLSSDKEQLASALQILDQDQLTLIIQESTDHLKDLDHDNEHVKQASENLEFIKGYIEFLNLEN